VAAVKLTGDSLRVLKTTYIKMSHADRTLVARLAKPVKEKTSLCNLKNNGYGTRRIRLVAQWGIGGLESCAWIFGCLVAFLGVLAAAHSNKPLFWLMVWPVPVAFACTVFIFVRQGFHFQNGVLVLGRSRD
jgi:hypothetical protein